MRRCEGQSMGDVLFGPVDIEARIVSQQRGCFFNSTVLCGVIQFLFNRGHHWKKVNEGGGRKITAVGFFSSSSSSSSNLSHFHSTLSI